MSIFIPLLCGTAREASRAASPADDPVVRAHVPLCHVVRSKGGGSAGTRKTPWWLVLPRSKSADVSPTERELVIAPVLACARTCAASFPATDHPRAVRSMQRSLRTRGLALGPQLSLPPAGACSQNREGRSALRGAQSRQSLCATDSYQNCDFGRTAHGRHQGVAHHRSGALAMRPGRPRRHLPRRAQSVPSIDHCRPPKRASCAARDRLSSAVAAPCTWCDARPRRHRSGATCQRRQASSPAAPYAATLTASQRCAWAH